MIDLPILDLPNKIVNLAHNQDHILLVWLTAYNSARSSSYGMPNARDARDEANEAVRDWLNKWAKMELKE